MSKKEKITFLMDKKRKYLKLLTQSRITISLFDFHSLGCEKKKRERDGGNKNQRKND